MKTMYKINKLHLAVRDVYSGKAQKTSKRGKKIHH